MPLNTSGDAEAQSCAPASPPGDRDGATRYLSSSLDSTQLENLRGGGPLSLVMGIGTGLVAEPPAQT
jgi:hypothetical protein